MLPHRSPIPADQVLTASPSLSSAVPTVSRYTFVSLYVLLHIRNTEVVQPSPHEYFDSFYCFLNVSASAPGSVLPQSILGFLPCICMDPDIDPFSVLPITKARILKISDRKYTYRTTFLSVRLQFQCFFQVFCTGFQQSFRGSFALCKQLSLLFSALMCSFLLSGSYSRLPLIQSFIGLSNYYDLC